MAERGLIKNVMSFGLEVVLPDGRTGYVHMTDIEQWPEDPNERAGRFHAGEWITVEVTSTDGVALGLRPVGIESLGAGSAEAAGPGSPATEASGDGGTIEDDLPADDPDPFSETALDPTERRSMLEKLAEHMRPLLADASTSQREELEGLWTELRRQTTIEGFRGCAERLLSALEQLSAPTQE